MLYAGNTEACKPLLPVLETPEEEKRNKPGIIDAQDDDGTPVKQKGAGDEGLELQDKLLMPPPKALPKPTANRYRCHFQEPCSFSLNSGLPDEFESKFCNFMCNSRLQGFTLFGKHNFIAY